MVLFGVWFVRCNKEKLGNKIYRYSFDKFIIQKSAI